MGSKLPTLIQADFPPHSTGSQSDLRLLKSYLVNLAANYVLSWTVVSAIFRLIPKLKGA